MWVHSITTRWKHMIDAIQSNFCKSTVYYTLKEIKKDALSSESYLLTINNSKEYYIYLLGDVTYALPQSIGLDLDMVNSAIFKALGVTIKLKNTFICAECTQNGKQIYVLQHLVPLGFFCLCKSLNFIDKLMR